MPLPLEGRFFTVTIPEFCGNLVGQTWSARVPLDPPVMEAKELAAERESGQGPAADEGLRAGKLSACIFAGVRRGENYRALGNPVG
jgi:hypothetical protein